jgi:AcrR family transcriptional regulator
MREGPRSKDDVIRAAGRLFAERGFHGTSMRDLGGELGLLGSSLYAHVQGKNELLIEVIRSGARLFQDLASRIQELDVDAATRLRLLIEGHVEIVTAHIDEATTFLNEARFLPAEERAVIVDMRDRYESAYRAVIDEGIASGEFREALDSSVTAILVLSMVNALDRWYRADGARSPSEIADRIFHLTMEGIA